MISPMPGTRDCWCEAATSEQEYWHGYTGKINWSPLLLITVSCESLVYVCSILLLPPFLLLLHGDASDTLIYDIPSFALEKERANVLKRRRKRSRDRVCLLERSKDLCIFSLSLVICFVFFGCLTSLGLGFFFFFKRSLWTCSLILACACSGFRMTGLHKMMRTQMMLNAVPIPACGQLSSRLTISCCRCNLHIDDLMHFWHLFTCLLFLLLPFLLQSLSFD